MDVYQTGRQSIQFQYDKDGDYLEFEVFVDHTVSMYVPKRDHSKAETHTITDDRVKVLNGFIQKHFQDDRKARK